jgi:hypothetical protein
MYFYVYSFLYTLFVHPSYMSLFFRKISALFLVFQLFVSTPGGIALAQELSENGEIPAIFEQVLEEVTVVEDEPAQPLDDVVEELGDEVPDMNENEGEEAVELIDEESTKGEIEEGAMVEDESETDLDPSEGEEDVVEVPEDEDFADDEMSQNDVIEQNVQDLEIVEEVKVLELSDVLLLLDEAFSNGSLSKDDRAQILSFLRELEVSDGMVKEVLARYPLRDKRELKKSTLNISSAVIPPGLLKKATGLSSAFKTDEISSSVPVEFVSERVLVQVQSKAAAERWISQSERENVEITVLMDGPQPLLRIDALDSTTTIGLLQRYAQRAEVVYQEPDYVYHTEAVPNDSTYAFQWHHRNTGGVYAGQSGTAGEDIQSQDAWDIFTGNGNVIVAVIDTGVMHHHPDLQARMWDGSASCVDQNGVAIPGGCPNHGYDFFDLDNDPNDESNHGTMVAGSLAAHGNNGTGVAGVNWSGKIMALKTGTADSSSLSGSAIVSSIYFAVRNGAKIINMSFSSSGESTSITNAINFARTNNVLVFASAGNSSLNLDIPGQNAYPCETNLDNIICVASTNVQGTLNFLGSGSTSNYGQTSVDLAAPGDRILTTAPVQTDIYVNAFENGANDVNQFTISGGSGWGLKDTGANKLLTSHISGAYGNNESTFAEIGQNFNLSAYKSGTLFFEMNCLTDNAFDGSGLPVDGVAIDFSHDGGLNYQEAASFNGTLTALRAQFDVGPHGLPLITIGLTSEDFVSQFRFRFRFFSNSTTVGTGCDIDEVRLRMTSGSTYLFATGTSFASPVTAGLASLMWEYDPSMSYLQIRNLLISGGESLPALATTTISGKRINSYRSLALMTDPAVKNLQAFVSNGGAEFFDDDAISSSGPFFSWTAPTGQGIISGYSFAIDGVPDAVVDTTALSRSFSGLTEGPHTFQVVGVNDVGVMGTVSEISFIVDTLAPDEPMLLEVNGNDIVNALNESSSVLTGSVSEDVSLSYFITDVSSPDVLGSQAVSAGAFSISGLDLSGLNDGSLSVAVILTDAAGNSSPPGVIFITKDTQVSAPTQLQFNGGQPINAATASTVNLTFSTTENGSALFTISNGVDADLTATIPVTGVNTSFGIDHTSLSDGVLDISVLFTDSAGNTASLVQTTLVKDTEVDAVAQVQLNSGTGVNASNASSTSLSFEAFESGSATYVLSDGTAPNVSGSVAVAGSGMITVPNLNLTTLDDGSLDVSVTFTDAVGNVSAVSSESVLKDTQVAPAFNVQLNGGVTILAVNQASVQLTFETAEAGSATYSVSDGTATVNDSVAVAGAGMTTVSGLNVSTLDDGTLTLSVVFTDSVLNTASAGTGNVEKDSSVLAPTNVQLNAGVTINFNARTDVDLSFQTTEAGMAAYSISDGTNTMNDTVVVTGSGTTSVEGLDVSGLSDGTLNLSVVLTDTPGNVSASGLGTVEKDTIVNAATAVNLNSGAGVNAATVANTSLLFDTLEAGTATYTISDGTAPDVTGSTAVSGAGTTTVSGLNLSSLDDGSISISVVFTDSVNNVATAGTGSSQKDVLVDAATDVQLNAGLTINAALQSAVDLTFTTTESGSATYALSDGVNPSLTGSIAVSGAGTTTVSAINVGALSNGTISLSVVFTDALGNQAAAGVGSVLKDSDIPVAPQSVQLNGGVTLNAASAGSVDVTGTVSEAGSLLYAVLDEQSNAVNGSMAVSAGAFTISGLDLSGLNDGVLTVYVTLTDDAGNTSLDGNDSIQKDVLVQAAVNVLLNGGVAINATTQTDVDLSFETTEAGTVQYTISNGATSLVDTVAVTASGTTTVSDIDVSLIDDGTLNISVLFTDTAGNTASAGVGTVEKDGVVPQAPQNVFLNGGVTILQSNQSSVVLTGSVGEAGTLEYILSDGVNPDVTGSQAVVVGPFTVSGLNVSSLNDGTINFSARVTDAAGNESSEGVSSVSKDTQISPATGVQLNGGITINAAAQTNVSLVFNAGETGSAVYSISDGTVMLSDTVAVLASGVTTLPGFDVTSLDDGTLNISVLFTDTAGNPAAAALGTVLKDTLVSAPQNVSLNNQVDINAAMADSVTLAGDVAESGTLDYTISDGTNSVSASSAVVSGGFSFPGIDVSALMDGVLLISVTLTDDAGNLSASTQVGLLKDTVIDEPTLLVINNGQAVTFADQNTVSFTFTLSEAGTVDYVFTDGVDSVSDSEVFLSSGAKSISSVDVSSLADGLLTLTLTFRDDVGNIASDVTDTVLKDSIAETPTNFVINGGQSVNLSNQSLVYFRAAFTETGTLSYQFTDTVSTVSDTIVVSATGIMTISNIDLSAFDEGAISAELVFTDDLGNVSTTVADTVVKDTIVDSAAQVVLNAGLPVDGASASSITLTFVVNELGTANYIVTDENSDFVTGTILVTSLGLVTITGIDVSQLADGTLTPSVEFVDAAGNSSMIVLGASIEKVETLVTPGTRRSLTEELLASGGGGGSSGASVSTGSVLSESVSRPDEEEVEDAEPEVNDEVEEEEVILPFVDLSEDDEVYAAVQYLYEEGIVRGQGSSNRFDPQGVVDWAQALKMLLLLSGEELPSQVLESPFPDVEIDAWFAPYFALAKKLGFIKGNADGRVIPWQAMNRAEAVVLVQRVLGTRPEVISRSLFEDVETGVWFSDALHDAVERGLLKTRNEDGVFADPTALITREEFVMLLVGSF